MEGAVMSRRKRVTRAFAIAALGLGLAAPVAQARPLDVTGQSWTSAAAVTVGAAHQASTPSHGSLSPALGARFHRDNVLASAGQASTGLVEQSAKENVNWTVVGLGTSLSILVIGAFGITAYRLRIR